MTDRPDVLANRVRAYTVDLSDVPDDAPVFQGTAVPVEYLFRYLDERYSLQSFLKDFPTVGVGQALTEMEKRAEANIPASSDKDRMGGTPILSGSRVPVSILFSYLKHEDTIDEFLTQYPIADRTDVVRTLELASDLLEAVAYGNADWAQ